MDWSTEIFKDLASYGVLSLGWVLFFLLLRRDDKRQEKLLEYVKEGFTARYMVAESLGKLAAAVEKSALRKSKRK